MEKIGAYTDRVTDSGEWRPGNPATGQQATPMLSQYFNMLQRELVNVVESTGNVLNKEDDTQLLTAINQLIGGAIGEKLIVRASASTALTDKQMGLVLIDASGQDVTIALPAADAALGVVDVILWRTDGTARTCTIAPAGVDRIMRDTAQYPAGQSSETLQFSGDWLHLRADAAGKWWAISVAASPVPAGTVVAFAGQAAPSGYLLCNGAELSRTAYASLFSVIGTIYGNGDGSTTFSLPDLRGEFIRGWDAGRGIDPDREVGSFQLDELKKHTHRYLTAGSFSANFAGSTPSVNYGLSTPQTDPAGGVETRPRNVAMNYIIKY